MSAATWEAFPVKAGDRLSFGFLKSGARAYIAVSGGIDVPVKLGSRSTYTLGALGGHEGRASEGGGQACPLGQGRGRQGGHPGRPCVGCRAIRLNCGCCRGFTGTASPGRCRKAVLCRHLEGGPRSGPHRLSLQGRHSAGLCAARTTLWCGVEPVEHRGCLLSLWLGSGAGRHGTHRACTAMRCRAGAT